MARVTGASMGERIRRAVSFHLVATAVMLVTAIPSMAACKMAGDPMGPAVLAGYVVRPNSILFQHPLGGVGMNILAAQLAVANIDSLTAMMSIVPEGSNKQRGAIGSGLAAAANTCQKQDSGVVQRIINAVKRSGSAALQRAFAIDYDAGPAPNAASGDTQPAITSGQPIPQDLTLPRLTTTNKLPNPFGPPDGWR